MTGTASRAEFQRLQYQTARIWKKGRRGKGSLNWAEWNIKNKIKSYV